jgi:hypothetical protein
VGSAGFTLLAPNLPPVAFNDLLADRKSPSRTGLIGGNRLERLPDTSLVALGDAGAIVLDSERDLVPRKFEGELDFGLLELTAGVQDDILNQVLNQLGQQALIPLHDGPVAALNTRAACFQQSAQ